MSAEQTIQKVPFFNYSAQYQAERAELLTLIDDVASRGAYIMQAELLEFERELANHVGVKYVLGVGNATDGLMIACKAAGIRAGDEVILSSHTMIATAIGVHFAGGIAVPVDCGADHLIDPEAVSKAVTSRTRAILPTHLNGRTCDMTALQSIADQYGLIIIEDAAQALGSKFRNRSAGSFGVASAISFYPAKLLGCLGDGGAVLTSDDAVYEQLWQLRDFGRDFNGTIVSWGVNTRLDNIQAAILTLRLRNYERSVARRRQIASLYHELLRDVPGVALPAGPNDSPNHFDVYQNFEIEADRRDSLKAFLSENGIGTLIQWGGQAIHQIRSLGFTQELERTDRLFARLLMLPMNLSLTDGEVEYVSAKVREFYDE